MPKDRGDVDRRLSGDWVGCGLSKHPETWLRGWAAGEEGKLLSLVDSSRVDSWPWFHLLPGFSLLLEGHAAV